MKLKRMLVACVAGILISGMLIGCQEQEKDTVKQESTKNNKEERLSTEKQEQQEPEKAFSITREIYEEGDIHIEYPHVENLVNQKITDWYNEQFKSRIAVYTEGEVEEGDITAESQSVNETFQVTYQSEDMVSILIDGYFYADSAAHPSSYKNSYNINLKTGESMSITDEYDVEQMADDLLSGQFYTGIRDIENSGEMSEEEQTYLIQEMKARDRDFTLESLNKCDYRFCVNAEGK